MTLKHYHYLQDFTGLMVLAVIIIFLSQNNYLIPIIAMVVAYALIFFTKHYVKEVVQDERDKAISGEAFRMAVYTYAFLSIMTIILLSASGYFKEEYLAIFITFIVSICLIFFLQKLFYIYYQKFAVLEKKKIYIVFGIIMLLILLLGMIRFFSGEDDWICKDGQWVKHGNPEAAMPSSKCQ